MTELNYYEKYMKYKNKYIDIKGGGKSKELINNKVITINKGTRLYRVRNLNNKEKLLNDGYNLFFVPNNTKYNNNDLLVNIFTLWQFRAFESNNDKNVINLIVDVYEIKNSLTLYLLDMNKSKKNNLLNFEKKINKKYSNYEPNFRIENNMLKGDNFKIAQWISDNDNVDGWFCLDGKRLDEMMIINSSQSKIKKVGEIILDDLLKTLFEIDANKKN